MKVVTENINSAKRTEWLKRIMEIRNTECVEGDKICLSFGDIPLIVLRRNILFPWLVLLSFWIERKSLSLWTVILSAGNTSLQNLI